MSAADYYNVSPEYHQQQSAAVAATQQANASQQDYPQQAYPQQALPEQAYPQQAYPQYPQQVSLPPRLVEVLIRRHTSHATCMESPMW